MVYITLVVGLIIGLLVGYLFARRTLRTKNAGTLILIDEEGSVSLYVELNDQPETLQDRKIATFDIKRVNPSRSTR